MPFLKTVKPLVIYLIIIIIIALGLNLFLRNYSKTHYSDQKKEELLSTPSQFRLLNEDPCANSIYGDPGNVADNYVKINLHCSKDNSSTNTVEVRTISPDNYRGTLELVGKINTFHADVSADSVNKLGNLVSENGEWKCFTGIDSEIKNFSEKVKIPLTINCFYKFSDQEMRQYYETH